MIFEFFVDDNIFKKNNNIVDNNKEYYKCRFYINQKIWKDSFLYATFINDAGYIETIPLGECNNMLTCLIPNKFLDYDKVLLYIFSDDFETDTIIINLKNSFKAKKKPCNVLSEIFAQIDSKIDNIIYENYQLKCYSHGKVIDTIYLSDINVGSSLYLKEDVENKTTEISADSTDDQYPSAKATYEYINNIIGQIEHDMQS